MKAIILAAGQGTRLRPLTDYKPKCLVELAGKPLLSHQIEVLKDCGINDIHVVGGYRADQLTGEDYKLHHNLHFAVTNMVYTLFVAEKEFNSAQDIIIAYGDIIYQKNVLDELIKSDAPVSVVIDSAWSRYWHARMDNPLDDAESLKIDDSNRITEIGKVPVDMSEINGQYIGLLKIRSDFANSFKKTWEQMDRQLTYDGNDYNNMYMTTYIQELINQNWDVKAVFIENGWAEIDCPSDLDVALEYCSI